MKKKLRIMSLLLIASILLTLLPGAVLAADSTMSFQDVKTGDWFYAAVQYVYDEGLMSGTSANTFAPNDVTTRGMIVTILHRMSGAKGTETGEFTDVKAGQYYTDAVAWASKNGIVNGYGNGKFGPNDPITREQMASILYRYSKFAGNSVKESAELSSYSDSGKVSSYAVEAMKWAVGKGLISGTGNNMLSPAGSATRAQVATILARFCGADLTVKVEAPTFDAKSADRYISAELYVDHGDDSFVTFDEKSGLKYYSNELIIYARGSAHKQAIASLVEKDGGYIVGRDGYTDSYQIRFPSALTKEKLDALIKEYEASKYVDSVFFNLALSLESDAFTIPNTAKWPGTLWEDGIKIKDNLPDENWGIEVIKARQAWSLYDKMQPVQVGVFDGGCDPTHQDLKGVITDYILGEKEDEDNINHGTHVSGTIAANFDNTGICGVAPTAKLSVIDVAAGGRLTPSFYYTAAYSYLLGQQKCKVVNMSLGEKILAVGVQYENEKALNQMAAYVAQMIINLNRLKEVNSQFTICVSAGNNNGYTFYADKTAEYGYYMQCPDSEHGHTKPHYIDNDGNCQVCSEEMKKAAIKGNMDARFGKPLTAITGDLEERIIVVGACSYNGGNYKQTSFSSIGSRVDVIAPGYDIESCISRNRYARYPGTSMASPHVAGVAAMLYALDPNISGERVKKIIVETADIDVGGTDKNMVNAYAACMKVVGEKMVDDLMLAKVVDAATNQPIDGVTVKAVNRNYDKKTLSAATGSSGTFAMKLNEIDASHETLDQIEFTFTKGDVTYTGTYDRASLKKTEDGAWNVTFKLTAASQTKTLSGTVVDKQTKKNLTGVSVYVYDANRKSVQYNAKTGSDGTFVLKVRTGEYALKFVKADTYEEKWLNASVTAAKNVGTVELTPIAVQQPTVQQTAKEAFVIMESGSMQIKLQNGQTVSGTMYQAIVNGEYAKIVTDDQTLPLILAACGRAVVVTSDLQMVGLADGVSQDPVYITQASVRKVSPLSYSVDANYKIENNTISWNDGTAKTEDWCSVKIDFGSVLWAADGTTIRSITANELNSYLKTNNKQVVAGYFWPVDTDGNGRADCIYLCMEPAS